MDYDESKFFLFNLFSLACNIVEHETMSNVFQDYILIPILFELFY